MAEISACIDLLSRIELELFKDLTSYFDSSVWPGAFWHLLRQTGRTQCIKPSLLYLSGTVVSLIYELTSRETQAKDSVSASVDSFLHRLSALIPTECKKDEREEKSHKREK